MNKIFKSKKQMFEESLMKICNMDSSHAQMLSSFISENQIIRPICNEPISFVK